MNQSPHLVETSRRVDAFVLWFVLLATLAGCGEDMPKPEQRSPMPPGGPTAAPDQASGAENERLIVDVLVNDSDPGGLALSIEAVQQGEYGVTSVEDDQVVYEPRPDFDGEDSFEYTVANAKGERASAVVTVTILGDDDPPVTAGDVVVLSLDRPFALNVLDNDHDPEGGVLTATLTVRPEVGGMSLTREGEVQFVPPAGFNGGVSFEYVAHDEGGSSTPGSGWITVYDSATEEAPAVVLPETSLLPKHVGLVVNLMDPDSVAIGASYAAARHIPSENVFEVSFEVTGDVMQPADFAVLYTQLGEVPGHIQAWALTWMTPYRVGCMSMTSAFAFGGYEDKWCNTSGSACSTTFPAETFGSDSVRPFTDHGTRPAMMLAGESVADVEALITRGVAADHTFPTGDGYLVRTTDSARSVRHPNMLATLDDWDHEGGLALSYVDNSDGSGANVIRETSDVLFYFTGLADVPDIATNTYRPGAVADHLTSFGGRLTGSGQMSVIRWLEAGATGSYGTVVEPCNYTQKFPDVRTFLPFYFRGQTLLEAYWKSVHWPGEGVFVGEPLARPWGKQALSFDGVELVIRTTWLRPKATYAVEGSSDPAGPWRTVEAGISVPDYGQSELRVRSPTERFYRLVEE